MIIHFVCSVSVGVVMFVDDSRKWDCKSYILATLIYCGLGNGSGTKKHIDDIEQRK
jgi:hypothetical protein